MEDIISSQQESLDLRVEYEVEMVSMRDIKDKDEKNRKSREFLNEFNQKFDKHFRKVYSLTKECSQFLATWRETRCESERRE